MVRTIISIPREIKVWIDDYSKKNKRPAAETIREALILYKEKMEHGKNDALKETAGIWKDKKIDGSKYVSDLRSEWK